MEYYKKLVSEPPFDVEHSYIFIVSRCYLAINKSAQNITFVFHYKWNHVKQEITIPFGTAVDLSCDWYGPAKMGEMM